MGLLDDMQSRIRETKDQLIEASGIDSEEAKQNIDELKQGLSGLGKQLVKSGQRLRSSVKVEVKMRDSENSNDKSHPAGNPSKDVKQQKKRSGSSADEEIRIMEEKLERLRKKKESSVTSNDEAPRDATPEKNLSEMPTAAPDNLSKASGTADNNEPIASNERRIEDLPPIENANSRPDLMQKSVTISLHTLIVAAASMLILLFGILLGVSTCNSAAINKQTDNISSMSPPDNQNVMESPAGNTIKVSISIECDENLMFSRYDIEIIVDDISLGVIEHGSSDTFQINLEPGSHELTVRNEDDPSVDGTVSFDTSQCSSFSFFVHCTSSQVEITEYVQVKAPMSSDEAIGSQLNVVETSFRSAGFEEITITEEASLPVSDMALAGTVKSIVINEEEFFEEGSAYFSNVPVEIVYLSVGDIHPPRDSSGYEGMTLEAARSELEAAGFTNIVVENQGNGSQGGDAVVDYVEIGMFGFLGFTTSDSFSTDEEVRIYLADSGDAEADEPGEDASVEVLTVDNCEDLRTLLNQGDTNAAWFASEYYGRTIEFDAAVWGVSRSEGYTQLWDIFLLAGNYETDGTRGPNFRFIEVAVTESWCESGRLSVGENVHVIAEVRGYDETRDWLEIKPVAVTKR